MKRILLLIIVATGFFSVYAQSPAYYNYQGDQALLKEDYQAARSWYSMGLDSCDRYSVQKLVEIWMNQPAIRESMQLPMRKSFNCMQTIVETREPEMMRLFSDFYKYGIGTRKDTTLYNYWYNEWWSLFKTTLDIAPEKLNSPKDSSAIEAKVPKKSFFSDRFRSFIAYTFSPTMPFGLTAGIYFDKLGAYVGYRNDFGSVNTAYDCNNTSVPDIVDENPPYEFRREKWHSQMITGGLMYPLIKNRLFVSLGGGYGIRDYYREIVSTTDQPFSTDRKKEWCSNTEASYKGFTLEAGGMWVWKKMMVLGGVNSTQFNDFDIYIGLGITF